MRIKAKTGYRYRGEMAESRDCIDSYVRVLELSKREKPEVEKKTFTCKPSRRVRENTESSAFQVISARNGLNSWIISIIKKRNGRGRNGELADACERHSQIAILPQVVSATRSNLLEHKVSFLFYFCSDKFSGLGVSERQLRISYQGIL